MEYREVTGKLLELDKEMSDDAKAIVEAYEKQKAERSKKFEEDVRAVVKDWTVDDMKAWSEQAYDDDAVDALFFNTVVMVWALAHPNDVKTIGMVMNVDNADVMDGATLNHGILKVLGMVASIYEDLHG